MSCFKINGRYLLKWCAEGELESIWRVFENRNLYQGRGFVYLVMFRKLNFKQSHMIGTGPFISSYNEIE